MSKNLSTTDMERLSVLMDNLEKAKGDENEKKVIMAKIMDFFRQTGMKSFRYGDIVVRFVETRTTEAFDVDLLREKYPTIWAECHTTQFRPATISITKKPLAEKEQ